MSDLPAMIDNLFLEIFFIGQLLRLLCFFLLLGKVLKVFSESGKVLTETNARKGENNPSGEGDDDDDGGLLSWLLFTLKLIAGLGLGLFAFYWWTRFLYLADPEYARGILIAGLAKAYGVGSFKDGIEFEEALC